jgi:RimJ/RimL family protein N-acetyltransferase
MPLPAIQIRPLVPSDRAALFAAVRESIETVSPWMGWCHAGYSIEESDAWIALCQHNWQTSTEREFGIFSSASGVLLGCAGMNQINTMNNFGNLGYWVRAGHVRRGVATAAAALVAQFAFREMRLTRAEIVVRTDNRASRRVAEKLGARFECIARNRLMAGGSPVDAALFSLTPDDCGVQMLDPQDGGLRCNFHANNLA